MVVGNIEADVGRRAQVGIKQNVFAELSAIGRLRRFVGEGISVDVDTHIDRRYAVC